MGGGGVEPRISPSRIFLSDDDGVQYDGPFNPSINVAKTTTNGQIFFPNATTEDLNALSEELVLVNVQTDDIDYEEGIAYIGLVPEEDNWSVSFEGNDTFAPFSLQVSVQ